MNAIVRQLALCAGLVLSASSPVPAAQNAVAPPLRSSLRDLATLLTRVPEQPPSLAFDRRRALAAVTRLQALSANWPAESPADYRLNLARDVAVLSTALAEATVGRLGATLEAIADDLQIKLEHCTKSGGKLGGSVVVRVRTVRAGDEVKNWEVFYLPRVLEAAGSATPDRFPRLSSPTNESLVPGRYVMWLKDPASARVSDRVTVKVGEGMKELLLDLALPAETRR